MSKYLSNVVTVTADQCLCFPTKIVQSLYFLNQKFQASSHLLWLYSLVCGHWSDLVRNPEDRFSCDMAHLFPGQWSEALSEYKTELGLQEALGDTIDAAVACRNIGECYCGLDQFDKALNLQQRHLNLAR